MQQLFFSLSLSLNSTTRARRRLMTRQKGKNFDDDALLKVTESLKSVVTSLADNDALSRGTGGYGDLGNVFWWLKRVSWV